MKYVKVKYVDSKTGIPGNIEPCRNGPIFPKLVNFELKFTNRADWPVTKDGDDTYWGTCWESSNTNILGVTELSQEEWETDYQTETAKLSAQQLSIRDKLLSEYQGNDTEYRAQLNDLDKIDGFPWNFDFPVASNMENQ